MNNLPLIYLCVKLASDMDSKYYTKTANTAKTTTMVAPPEPQVDLRFVNAKLHAKQKIAELRNKAYSYYNNFKNKAVNYYNSLTNTQPTVNKPAALPPYDPNANYIPSTYPRPKGYYKWAQVLRAMKQEESINGKKPYGDYKKGKPTRFGSYHIGESYYKDTKLPMLTWQKDVMDDKVSEDVIHRYMKRYAKQYVPKNLDDWLSPRAISTITRIHNGGPNAPRATGEELKKVTEYNKRIQRHLINLYGE